MAALQREGFSITTEALLAANPDSVITRANIARFLYDSHQIRSVSEAFENISVTAANAMSAALKSPRWMPLN